MLKLASIYANERINTTTHNKHFYAMMAYFRYV